MSSALAPAPERQTGIATRRVVEDDGPIAFLMDTARFEHLQRIALVMANSSLLPNHLRYEKGNANNPLLPAEVIAANCFRIVNQAMRWNFDPFAIIDETYMVGGKLGYQGKLVAAVVNARAGLNGRLNYEFDGQGDNLTITVIGTFKNDATERSLTLRVGDAKTDNQMWRKDPEQKLVYSGVVKWARRFCPEVVLGVVTDDDLDRMNASTPAEEKPQTGSRTSSLLEKIKKAAPAQIEHSTGALIEQSPEDNHDATPSEDSDQSSVPHEASTTKTESAPSAVGESVAKPIPDAVWMDAAKFENLLVEHCIQNEIQESTLNEKLTAWCKKLGGGKLVKMEKLSPNQRRMLWAEIQEGKFFA